MRKSMQSLRLIAVALMVFGLPLGARGAPARPPCASCVTVVIGLEERASIPDTLNGLGVLVELNPGSESEAATLIGEIGRRGGHPGLLVRGLPTAPLPAESSGVSVLVVDVRGDASSREKLTFELKTRLTALRGSLPTLRLGIAVPEDAAPLMLRELTPYVDFVVAGAEPSSSSEASWWRAAEAVATARAALDLTRATDAERVLVRASGEELSAAMSDLARAIPFLASGLVETEEISVDCAGRGASVWKNISSGEYIVWGVGCGEAAALRVPSGFTVVARSRLSSGDLLATLMNSGEQRFAESLEIAARRTLTVGEIIARHQAAVARQTAQVRTLISTGTMTLTFEAPAFPAPITVTAESIFYAGDGRSEIEQRSIRVNGIEFKEDGIPRLPIVEPERVSAPPLAITLTDAYRYELKGTADVDGTTCYVVAFKPASREGTYFEGQAWIDAASYGLVRVSARQTGLRGPIVASEQVDDFRREPGDVWLLSRSHVRQLYEGAAHRTPIDRVFVIARHEIDPEDFAARRSAAHSSGAVILRDSPRGYRYLRPADDGNRSGSDGRTEGDRETVDRATRVRTMVLGTILDPNISHPLPFAGVSYVDFDLLGTGAQLNAFFGGMYGQLAFSVPSIAGTRWQLGGQGFAILSAFNDRAFVGGLERYQENISQRPAHGSVWAVRPLSPRFSVRAGYEVDFTHFSASDTTSPTFLVPADQLVHGFRASLDTQRGGWRASAWWNPAVRSGWRQWGSPDDSEYERAHHDFQRVGASLMRLAVLSPGLVVRGEASWMAGRDLDRFSRFAFGAFENRLHGFPAALIRYDRGAVLRASAAWSLRSRMRLDAFVDRAFVHDPGFGEGMTRLTGLGSGVEAPAPFGTLISAEWGYGIEGRRADGRRGTHVIRITAYKLF